MSITFWIAARTMVGCCRRERQCLIFNSYHWSYLLNGIIAATVRFQKSRTVFLCPVSCQVRIVPIFYRIFRHFAYSQPQHLVVSYSRLFDTTTRRHIMQYTDNEAALIGGLISTYFLRPAVSAALKDSYTRVLEHLRTGRLSAGDLQQIQKGADVPDADLPDVQRSAARPDGRQSQDNGAASFLPLRLRSVFIAGSYRLRGILRRRLSFARFLYR